jgi:hypothetical protein
VKNVLTEAFKKGLDNEEYKKTLDQMGGERIFIGAKEAATLLKTEDDFFKKLTTKRGFKPEQPFQNAAAKSKKSPRALALELLNPSGITVP